CSRYISEPGVINSSFSVDRFFALQDGRWMTATSTDILLFRPDTLNNLRKKPLPVEISGLKVFDKPMFIDSLLLRSDPVKLNYRQNFLTIEFATLLFSNPKQLKYHYLLSGVDRDWVPVDMNGSANYTNLSPGNYTFSVMAGDESDRGKAT